MPLERWFFSNRTIQANAQQQETKRLASIRLPGAGPSSNLKQFYAPVPLLPADSARNAEGGRYRLAPVDAARRYDAAGGGRHLCLSAARFSCTAEDLPDRARGAGPLGRNRASDADHPVRRLVARERPL